MANRKGRPTLPDEAALRRVAEYMVSQEEGGKRCSARAAILRTSDGRPTGNSPDADLWRMQRKWRRLGDQLLKETRERRAKAKRRQASWAYGGGLLGSSLGGELMLQLPPLEKAQRLAESLSRLAVQEEARRWADTLRRFDTLMQEETRSLADTLHRFDTLMLQIASRNLRDFDRLGVPTVNPLPGRAAQPAT